MRDAVDWDIFNWNARACFSKPHLGQQNSLNLEKEHVILLHMMYSCFCTAQKIEACHQIRVGLK